MSNIDENYKETSRITIPAVGMPATYCIGSDCYGGQITRVTKSAKYVIFKFNNSGREEKFSLRKNGYYESLGRSSGHLSLGKARDYMDPHF